MPTDKKPETTDVFEFINRIDAVKNELQIELFFFNKNYTPYAVNISNAVLEQIRPLFLYNIINDVTLGAGTGLVVRDLEYLEIASKQDNVLLHENLGKVGRAETVIHLIENERDDIVFFSQEEHEFKRMKGIVARFTNGKEYFYVIKLIEQTKALTSSPSVWQFSHDTVDMSEPQVTFKVPEDNQILVTNGDIFIFNQNKFEKLFEYHFVKLQQADAKAELFEKKFKISLPGDLAGLGNILRESNALLNKFLNTDIDLLTQEQVIEIAESMQVELMTDDAGAIIIMEKSDLNIMLDIMNDNYFQSEATGNHYVAKSKKSIDVAEE